jgi:peptidyl-prolyl cis-trans isomerase SurA
MNLLPRRSLAPVLLLALHCSVGSAFSQNSYKVEVVINGKPIVSSEVRDAVNSQEQLLKMTERDPRELSRKLGELRQSALYALIERQLVLSEFEKLGGTIKAQYIDDDVNSVIRENFGGDRQKFLQELAKNEMTLRKFRQQRQEMMIISVLRSRQIRSLPPPTPAQVEKYYAENSQQFRDPGYIKFSTITIPKYPIGNSNATPEAQLKLAEEIRQKAVSGSDFGTLARTYSQDSRASDGGDWGLQDETALNKELAEVAFTLKPGNISKVVEISANYMIIYCEAKQPGKLKPLEESRQQIERVIKSEMGREALNRWLSSLAQRASIQPESVRKGFLEWILKNKAS